MYNQQKRYKLNTQTVSVTITIGHSFLTDHYHELFDQTFIRYVKLCTISKYKYS